MAKIKGHTLPNYEWFMLEYVANHRRIPEIAKQLCCTAQTVRFRIKCLGIELRDDRIEHGKHVGKSHRLPLPDDEIVRLYIEEKKTTTEISKIFSTTATTISAHLLDVGIKTRGRDTKEAVALRRAQYEIDRAEREEAKERNRVLWIKTIDNASLDKIDRWWKTPEGVARHYAEKEAKAKGGGL